MRKIHANSCCCVELDGNGHHIIGTTRIEYEPRGVFERRLPEFVVLEFKGAPRVKASCLSQQIDTIIEDKLREKKRDKSFYAICLSISDLELVMEREIANAHFKTVVIVQKVGDFGVYLSGEDDNTRIVFFEQNP